MSTDGNLNERSEPRTSGTPYRLYGLIATLLVIVCIVGVWNAEDIEVFGLSIPATFIILIPYLLGLIAGVMQERAKRELG